MMETGFRFKGWGIIACALLFLVGCAKKPEGSFIANITPGPGDAKGARLKVEFLPENKMTFTSMYTPYYKVDGKWHLDGNKVIADFDIHGRGFRSHYLWEDENLRLVKVVLYQDVPDNENLDNSGVPTLKKHWPMKVKMKDALFKKSN